ncbi:hypothetical protein B0I35DRAFT_435929 [Stachybotrys elegans]|uniref:Secreted protein n=1 Tax=Stachybotrys elegans TaxID=80388 RepID=A0A8K0SQ16_9HYPO|nr:hypothetical protein B0I35DRAFT_435929 [Stachybotrys elegans]
MMPLGLLLVVGLGKTTGRSLGARKILSSLRPVRRGEELSMLSQVLYQLLMSASLEADLYLWSASPSFVHSFV